MYVCMYMCMYMYVCISVCIYVCICVCMYVYMYICINVCMHADTISNMIRLEMSITGLRILYRFPRLTAIHASNASFDDVSPYLVFLLYPWTVKQLYRILFIF